MLLEAAYAAGDVVRYEDAVLLFSSQIASLHVSEKTGKYLGAEKRRVLVVLEKALCGRHLSLRDCPSWPSR